MRLLRRSKALPWVYDDGGSYWHAVRQLDEGERKRAFVFPRGDCVCRAIAVALQRPYTEVHYDLNKYFADIMCDGLLPTNDHRSPASTGVPRCVYEPYLRDRGWGWTPTMHIGSGCRVHLAKGELPSGRIIARVSKHLTAVIDGVVHDDGDPCRDGTRCVYGYYRQE